MKRVLLTTTAIVGLSAPAFAADPTAVSDQPYFHHSHPMTWSGSMSIKLTNQSTKDADETTEKSKKRDRMFEVLAGNNAALNGAAGAYEEITVAEVTERATKRGRAGNTINHTSAIGLLENKPQN
mgnify:CR=1 FL=1